MRKMHHNLTPYLLTDYVLCSLIGLILRLSIDRKKQPRPFWLFQVMASVAVSYVAYFSYTFYKIEKMPIEFWIMGLSFMGAFIVTTFDYIAEKGIIMYFRKLLEEILAFTNKKIKP